MTIEESTKFQQALRYVEYIDNFGKYVVLTGEEQRLRAKAFNLCKGVVRGMERIGSVPPTDLFDI
jgi:hypothetical protein